MAAEAFDGPAALGFRVRTGRTSAVVLGRASDGVRVLARRELLLFDERVPESFQPYHAGLDLKGAEAERVIHKACEAARGAARRAIEAWVEEVRSSGARLEGAGIVVTSDTDPATIANPHMRAHAAEGRLFGDLVREELSARGLKCTVVLEKDLPAAAARRLESPARELQRTVAAMGRTVGPPWRALEKASALAAWYVLEGAPRRS